jgi:hypothetical protein
MSLRASDSSRLTMEGQSKEVFGSKLVALTTKQRRRFLFSTYVLPLSNFSSTRQQLSTPAVFVYPMTSRNIEVSTPMVRPGVTLVGDELVRVFTGFC